MILSIEQLSVKALRSRRLPLLTKEEAQQDHRPRLRSTHANVHNLLPGVRLDVSKSGETNSHMLSMVTLESLILHYYALR